MFSKSSSLEGIARLAGQVVEKGNRISILARDVAHAEAISRALWQYHEFLPHELLLANEFEQADPISPISISTKPRDGEVVFVCDDARFPEKIEAGKLCLLFHASELDIVNTRRADWKRLNEEGIPLSYWAEEKDGGWKKQAEVNV